MPEDERDQWEALLSAPLPVVPGSAIRATPTAAEVEVEMDDFASLYAQVTGGAS